MEPKAWKMSKMGIKSIGRCKTTKSGLFGFTPQKTALELEDISDVTVTQMLTVQQARYVPKNDTKNLQEDMSLKSHKIYEEQWCFDTWWNKWMFKNP